MRIALVSAEFSGTVSRGGIATYLRYLADMMADRGHEVHAFFADTEEVTFSIRPGVFLHTVSVESRGDFTRRVVPMFSSVHRKYPFDLIEGAEFLAETAGVHNAFPSIPLVLKLHTPSALSYFTEYPMLGAWPKIRFIAGGLARGKLSKPYWKHNIEGDYERTNLASATIVTAPCPQIVERLADFWSLDLSDTTVIPNVFEPQSPLLAAEPRLNGATVAFFGRLELRKGVLDLAAAIPLILRRRPATRFRFVGRSVYSPILGADVGTVMKKNLKRWSDRIEFVGGLTFLDTMREYEKADVCAFPSVWENFPNVCLEAMAAARGVVASSAGGMASMIRHGETGLLIPPRDPAAIADAVLELLGDGDRRRGMGLQARAHVLEAYSARALGPLQEAVYERAIQSRRSAA